MQYEKAYSNTGAGYAGIFAAANLCKEGIFDVTIVDKNQYHQLLQQIHCIVSRTKKTGDITIEIGDLFRDKQTEGLSILKATVGNIDLKAKTVSIQLDGDGADVLSYDSVIVALGAETQYFGVDGALQNCLPFRSVQDALKIRNKIESLPKASSIVIAGGGPTGVSLAAALTELLSKRQ